MRLRTARRAKPREEEAGKKPMQGGQEPGRGVYLARRIVAALVILLLLIFLVPRACQAFLGPEEESNPVAPEKSPTEEETVSETEGTPAERDIGEEVGSDESVRSTVVVESEEAETQGDLKAPLDRSYFIGQVNEAAPVPSFGAAQQAIQPLPTGQPILPAEPVVVGPVLPTEQINPILPAEPVIAEPVLPAELVIMEPIFFEEPIFLNEPLFFEEPTFFGEEPVFEGTSSAAIAAAPEPDTTADTNGGDGAVAVAGPVSARA
jgi:hypothetical protein